MERNSQNIDKPLIDFHFINEIFVDRLSICK